MFASVPGIECHGSNGRDHLSLVTEDSDAVLRMARTNRCSQAVDASFAFHAARCRAPEKAEYAGCNGLFVGFFLRLGLSLDVCIIVGFDERRLINFFVGSVEG